MCVMPMASLSTSPIPVTTTSEPQSARFVTIEPQFVGPGHAEQTLIAKSDVVIVLQRQRSFGMVRALT